MQAQIILSARDYGFTGMVGGQTTFQSMLSPRLCFLQADEGTVSVRHRDKDDLGAKLLEEFIADVTSRSL